MSNMSHMLSALAVGVLASSVDGGVVSVNFADPSTAAMAANEMAGVVRVPHWNTFTQTTVAAGSALATVDHTGVDSGVKISWPKATDGIGITTTADEAGDKRMMRDGLYGTIELRVLVPAALANEGYKLIIYGDAVGAVKQETKIILKDNAASQVLSTVYLSDAGTDFSGTYVAADGASHLPIANITQTAHYYTFTNLSTTSLLLTINSPSTTPYKAMISGLQVVPNSYIPEPAGASLLLGLSGVTLLRWRR